MGALRAWLGRAATLLFLFLVLFTPRRVGATDVSAEAWTARCPAERGLSARVGFRAEELLVFELAPSGLKVEVRPDSPKSFRHAAGFGVSPVGEFADWNQVPAAHQAALRTFVECLVADPTLTFAGDPLHASERATPRLVGVAVPWLLLGGLAVLAAALWRARDLRRRLPLLAALFGATLALRALLAPWAFFHQNGQGPLWIDYALGEPSPYGPGYREVFAWVARWALDKAYAPDRAVFAAQAALGALVAPAGWLLAHRAGASPALCFAVAFLLAIDPSLARAAQSESYYATLASLLFLAAATLAVGAGRPRSRVLDGGASREPVASVNFGLSALGAGLFIAQAARLHPLGWVAAATVPLACLALPGRARTRVAQTPLAALGIGVVTLLGAGRALLAVAGGELGGQWLPEAVAKLGGASAPALSRVGTDLFIALAVFAVLIAVRRHRVALSLLVVGACLGAGRAANLLGGSPALILGGYWHLYAPALLVAAVALLAELAPRRRAATAAALAVAGGGALVAVAWWPDLTREPTDVREQSWAIEWRESLPKGARVAYVERAGARVLRLPLFGGAVQALYLEPGAPSRLSPGPAAPVYYVRTSVCASAEGRDRCRQFEERHRLRPVATRTLPAIASLPYLLLPEGTVDVGLYEVLPR